MKQFLQSQKTFFLLILCLLPFLVYLLVPGFFISDDGDWMVIRFSAFYEALRDGHFPVRWLGRLNHGYGYPVANFLYPGFMYMAVPLKAVGFGFAESIKILFVAGLVSSGIFSFLWLRTQFTQIASVVGALFYVYFPYHIFDFTKRGSIGEIVGLSLAPLVMYLSEKKQFVLAGVVFALLILSHNTLAFLFTPILFVTILLRQGMRGLIVLALGLMLSAFFWIPALFETGYTVFSTISVSSWEEYFLTPQTYSLFGISGGLVLIVAFWGIIKSSDRMYSVYAWLFIGSVLLALPLTAILWEVGILPKIVQFPWRFLLIPTLTGSFLIGFFLNAQSKKRQPLLAIIASAIILLSALPYLFSYIPVVRDDGYYATNEDTTTVKNEYMPKDVTQIPATRPEEKVVVTSGDAVIHLIDQKSHSLRFEVSAQTQTTLTIHTVYFPGWQVQSNGKTLPIHSGNADGLIQFQLSKGKHTIDAVFTETPLRQIANGITLGGIGSSLLLFIFQYKNGKRRGYNNNTHERKNTRIT